MTTKPDSNTRYDPAVTGLFEGAQPRPRAPAEDREAVFAAVYAQWDQLTARRVRRRRGAIILLAASLVMAVAVVILQPASTGVTPLVASLDRQQGSVLIERAGESVWRALRDGQPEIRAGDRVRAMDGAFALRLLSGASLRIGAHSTLVLLENATVELQSGLLYYDSELSLANAGIVVKTPIGTVRDIGTQFALHAQESTLSLSVRTGSASLDRFRHAPVIARAGHRIDVEQSGDSSLSAVSPNGAEWAWAEALAPTFELHNRRVLELLEWYARETAYRLEFASEATRQKAHNATLGGGAMDGATFEQLLYALETAGLVAERDVGRGTIVISMKD